MENQPQTAEQQERQERHAAAMKLLKIMETSPLDEALHFTCTLLAYTLWSAKVEPDSEKWWDFFRAFQMHVSDRVQALGSVPSPRIH